MKSTPGKPVCQTRRRVLPGSPDSPAQLESANCGSLSRLLPSAVRVCPRSTGTSRPNAWCWPIWMPPWCSRSSIISKRIGTTPFGAATLGWRRPLIPAFCRVQGPGVARHDPTRPRHSDEASAGLWSDSCRAKKCRPSLTLPIRPRGRDNEIRFSCPPSTTPEPACRRPSHQVADVVLGAAPAFGFMAKVARIEPCPSGQPPRFNSVAGSPIDPAPDSPCFPPPAARFRGRRLPTVSDGLCKAPEASARVLPVSVSRHIPSGTIYPS